MVDQVWAVLISSSDTVVIRYVDDIFVLCESVQQLEQFKIYLNSKHKNISFTSEIEIDGRLFTMKKLKGDILKCSYLQCTNNP